jgi:hypothetical protein
MKPVLVLKQQEIMPEVMNMASGAPSAMSSISPLAFVPLPSTTKDPISGRPLRAPQGVQYERPTFKPEVNPYGVFSSEGDFDAAPMFSSNLEQDETARAQLRRLGHDPKRINEMVGVERNAWAENRARRFDAKQERERAKFDTAQQKRQADMSLQEALSRQMAQSGGNTQAAFNQALRRTGRGALAGKIGAGALAGLTGLMALQRANESGTDLISALGGAGAQGYSTYRYANPTLQSLGMRGAAKISPPVGVSLPLRPPTSAGETPKTGQMTLDGEVIPDLKPTIADPTVKPADSLPTDTQNTLTGGYGEMHSLVDNTGHQGMADNSAATHGSVSEENQEKLENYYQRDWRDDTDWTGKGNRRSFIGVR